jgi:hypothetical protein
MKAAPSHPGSLVALARALRASQRAARPVRIEISFDECDGATLHTYEQDVVAAGGRVAWRDVDADSGSCLMAVDVDDRRAFERRWSVCPTNELGHITSGTSASTLTRAVPTSAKGTALSEHGRAPPAASPGARTR